MSKITLENRLNALETARPDRRGAADMSDRELCNVIGLGKNPTDSELQRIIEGDL